MMRLLEGLVWFLGSVAASGSVPELYHVDLQQALMASRAAAEVRSRLTTLQADLQEQAERRELQIAKLRKQAERSRRSADQDKLQRAVDEHARALEAAATRLTKVEAEALAPMISRARAVVMATSTPERRVILMEDLPLVGAPAACDRTKALTEALDRKAAFVLVPSASCRVRFVFALGFDAAVKASRAGIEAAQKVEALRARLQGEIDEKRRRVEPLAAGERYAAELELADQFQRNQDQLRALEEEEEARLYLRLARTVESVSAGLAEARFVDADAVDLGDLRVCRAETWSKDVLDGGADRAALLRVCGLKPPE